MFGMEIRINEKHIAQKGQYKIENIIATIDRICFHYGLRKKVEGRSLFYFGNNHKDDYAKCGIIYGILKRNRWFMENVTLWHLLENDDDEDENVEFCHSDFLSVIVRNNELNGLDPSNIEKS